MNYVCIWESHIHIFRGISNARRIVTLDIYEVVILKLSDRKHTDT